MLLAVCAGTLAMGAVLAMVHWNSRSIGRGVWVACAILLPLFGASVQNELRATQQSGWQQLGRSRFHWDNFQKREACIDALIDRLDPNYRTLPAGADVFRSSRGRNWKLLAETELNSRKREKVLFSYRELMHPYSALLYSRFTGGFASSNWFPPLSESVADNIDLVRFMGVRWVISADATISSPSLIERGRCTTPEPPFHETAAGGVVYVYEVTEPLGLTFLVDDYEVRSLPKTLQAIFQNQRPWKRSVVYVDGQPDPPRTGASRREVPAVETRSRIVHESFNTVDIDVRAATPKYLVLSYLYRPRWRAYVDGSEVTIHRAYGGFMAVPVPAGVHRLRFRYTPFDVYAGMILTVLAFGVPGFMAALAKHVPTWRAGVPGVFRRPVAVRWMMTTAAALILIVVWRGPAGSKREADFAFESGLYRTASEKYEELSHRVNFSDTEWIRFGDCYTELGQWQRAIAAYRNVTARRPAQALAWRKLGWASYELARTERSTPYDEAIAAFKTAAALDARNPDAFRGLGLSYYAVGRYRESESAIQLWNELAPENPQALMWLGLTASAERSDPMKAVAALERARSAARAVEPEQRSRVLYALADAYCRAGRARDCEAAFRQAEEEEPSGEGLDEAQRRIRDEVNARSALRSVRFWPDFRRLSGQGPERLVPACASEKLRVVGPGEATEGPHTGSVALRVSPSGQPSRVYGPPAAVTITDGSLTMWARLDDPGKRYSDLVATYSPSIPRVLYAYRRGPQGRFTIAYNGTVLNTALGVADTKWHHYALTWRDGDQRFYIDGHEAVRGQAAAPPESVTEFAVGWLGRDDQEQWAGALADLMTFNRALSAREISALARWPLRASDHQCS